jgi:hypothetical protein
MGYSIYIGNAVVETDEEELEAWYDVEHIEQEDAPYWPNQGEQEDAPYWPNQGDISGKTNGRHPSYSVMSEWAKETGLSELFFEKYDGLLTKHPGCSRITPEIHQKVKKARELWEQVYPNSKAGWCGGKDPILARLLWFEWWIKWALENCERPAISNS